jgi:hypothetical protein
MACIVQYNFNTKSITAYGNKYIVNMLTFTGSEKIKDPPQKQKYHQCRIIFLLIVLTWMEKSMNLLTWMEKSMNLLVPDDHPSGTKKITFSVVLKVMVLKVLVPVTSGF